MKRPSPVRDKVVELYLQGMSQGQIAATLGKTQGTVCNCISDARRVGTLPGYKPRIHRGTVTSVFKYAKERARSLDRGIGVYQNILGELPREISDWLIRATPKGELLTLTIKAIIIDAYNEENEA